MTTLELKNTLIQKIYSISDKSFLEALKTILEAKTESKPLLLTAEEKQEIYKSKKEIEKGLYIENNNLEAEIDLWLTEK